MKRLEFIKPLIDLSRTKDSFFVVRILQRRKDNPEMDKPERQLKVYSFYSWDEFEKCKDRIKEICDLNNARAYIRLDVMDALDISIRIQKQIAQNILDKNPRANERVWDSITGKHGFKDWKIIDIDTPHIHLLDSVIEDLEAHYFERNKYNVDGIFTREWSREINPIYQNKTQSGVHIICRPFDTRIISKYNQNLEEPIIIQDSGLTVLYIGNE